ncbi:DUF2281 domain-containing protein [Candidatus Bipolaricaulota bacterium]|nr:DUF2281 domain-containing protein [Candidatus Bipolaricaulota bacterium]
MKRTGNRNTEDWKKISDKLEELPEDKLKEVIDFANFLLTQEKKSPDRGTPEALLEHFGKPEFEEGELEELLADVQRAREQELEGDS